MAPTVESRAQVGKEVVDLLSADLRCSCDWRDLRITEERSMHGVVDLRPH